METMIYAGITVVILIIWYILQGKIMTPYDIYRKWKSDLSYIAPENATVMLAKTMKAIRECDDIFSAGPNTEAGAEAIEVIRKMRAVEDKLRLRS